jgi:16S rRNA processing protein RimM
LIGLRVKNLQDIDFGLIVDVFETGANDVIVVKPDVVESSADETMVADKAQASKTKADLKEKLQERLLPFTAAVVLEVDIKAKTMLVDWDADF